MSNVDHLVWKNRSNCVNFSQNLDQICVTSDTRQKLNVYCEEEKRGEINILKKKDYLMTIWKFQL